MAQLGGRCRPNDYSTTPSWRSLSAQFDPEPVYATMTAVAAGEVDTYRNLEPTSMLDETKRLIEAPWTRKVTDGLGTRPPQPSEVVRNET